MWLMLLRTTMRAILWVMYTGEFLYAAIDSISFFINPKKNHAYREMLYCLDQWLRERHIIPFVNPDLVFLCSREGEGVGGLVKAIIDNPLFKEHARPPEDDLVISLNNPIFSTNSTQQLDTAVPH